MAPEGKSRHVVRKADDHSTHLCTLPEDATLRYYSIGEFYAAIRDGVVYLEQQARAKGETIFTGDPARQALFAQATGLGPSAIDALALLPEAARAQNPAAHLDTVLPVDEGFWAENGPKLESRFAAWVIK